MAISTSPRQEAVQNSTEDFDKWIRMATDNKINSTNSWDLALIDYFYDLSVLRDGDGINFQKASATLDGCVKIYSSRVDSAATETGRLISGLSTRRAGKADLEAHSDSEDEFDEMDPEVPQRPKKSKTTTRKDTLVEFKAIKLRQMDTELYVDPLFKKALADFDEGGAKSLLLNMLSVDHVGRIVFDTTDSAEKARSLNDEEDLSGFEYSFADMDIDEPEVSFGSQTDEMLHPHIMNLGKRFLSDLMPSHVRVCPSISELCSVVDQKTKSTDLLKGLENMVMPQAYDYTLNGNYETTYQGFEVSAVLGGSHDDYSDDGEAYQDGSDPEPESNTSKYTGNKTSIFFNDLDDEADDYGVTMRMLFGDDKSYAQTHDDEDQDPGSVSNIPDEELLAYFDENQKKNWAGPEHWKITRLKKTYKIQPNSDSTTHNEDLEACMSSKPKKPKERVTIDFLSQGNFPDEGIIFQRGTASINLPKTQWVTEGHHTLPDDHDFSTRTFITLFTKSKLINGRFNRVKSMDVPINETLYADPQAPVGPDSLGIPPLHNADFFNDHGNDDGGYDGAYDDYDDEISPSQPPSSQLLAKSYGSQLPLNYSRVSKKVDIKLLKDNLWETLKQEHSTRRSIVQSPAPQEEVLKFSDIVGGLSVKYDSNAKKDLSTSFCFICLLHLANENGFTITNNEDNSDLMIEGFV